MKKQKNRYKHILPLFALLLFLLAGCAAAEEKTADPDTAVPELSEFAELSGKTVSMLTGAPFEELVRSKAPDVGNISYFISMPDMMLALKSGKTDAGVMNNGVGALAANRDPAICLFPQALEESAFGFAFAKGDPQRDIWQKAFDTIPEETKEALWEKWTGADESKKVLPAQDWPGNEGTVRVAFCDTLEPMSYMDGHGNAAGFDAEMLLLMAKELDLHVDFSGMEFSAILSSVQSGKADIGIGSIIVTKERKEAVDFVEYYPAAFVLIVRSAQTTAAGSSFFASLGDSFYKTFLREDRYLLFLEGIGMTVLIVVLSALFGTLLGFLIFLACRNGNRFALAAAGIFRKFMTGIPVVVLLMILYYIIFGGTSINGAVVSVIAFTMVFGAENFSRFQTAVGAVDAGQTEAALALGYPDRQAFFTHILPQALPFFLPGYRAGLVSLIKATSVVGYIAVQDLTKMGDIVRSRTYEAFFPLIAIAVIYFILSFFLVFAADCVTKRMDPSRRKKEAILKGII